MARSGDPPTTRVDNLGRTELLERVREKYDIDAGDELVWIGTESGVEIRTVEPLPQYGFLADEADMTDAQATRVAETLVEDTDLVQRPDFDG